MSFQKLSISLPPQVFDFIELYLEEHKLSSRSEVIKEALYLLQQKQLEADYKEANQDIDSSFDNTSMDGLDDEAW